MQPSKKIFIGSSLVVTGILLQLVLGLVTTNVVGDISSELTQFESPSASDGEAIDHMLEGAHLELGKLFVGYLLGYVLMSIGAMILLVGMYQTARSTELLNEELLERGGRD